MRQMTLLLMLPTPQILSMLLKARGIQARRGPMCSLVRSKVHFPQGLRSVRSMVRLVFPWAVMVVALVGPKRRGTTR